MTTRYDPERIRGSLRSVRLGRVHRLIHFSHRARPLDAVPTPSRFSDPAGQYAVLYVSESVRCGFWEALARNRFTRHRRRQMPRSDVESRLVVEIRSIEPLDLVDLREDGPIRIAAPTAVAHDANHAAGRSLSAATQPRCGSFALGCYLCERAGGRRLSVSVEIHGTCVRRCIRQGV